MWTKYIHYLLDKLKFRYYGRLEVFDDKYQSNIYDGAVLQVSSTVLSC